MESNPIVYSSVGVFKICLIVTHIFVAYSILELRMKLNRNLVTDIFKLSTSRQIGLSGCTFDQKDFTQVAQKEISLDAGAKPISTLVYQFWTQQFQATKLRMKIQPTNKSQETEIKISSF